MKKNQGISEILHIPRFNKKIPMRVFRILFENKKFLSVILGTKKKIDGKLKFEYFNDI